MSPRPISIVLTCEHGGNRVPPALRDRFSSADALRYLHSHRGYDRGALVAARMLSDRLKAPLEFSETSRLVVDLNRSLDSPELFSKFLSDLDPERRAEVLERYYLPYRRRILDQVERMLAGGETVLHISVHTFAGRYRGTVRRFDIGVLFDPDRHPESEWSQQLCDELNQRRFRARINEPYLGIDDGLTTALRGRFPAEGYSGVELELHDRFARLSNRTQSDWCARIVVALQATLAR